jgi:hypothetical protein
MTSPPENSILANQNKNLGEKIREMSTASQERIDSRLRELINEELERWERETRSKLYLVTGPVRERWYLSDTERCWSDCRLVMADNPDEAAEKFAAHWTSIVDDYAVYYYVDDVQVHAIIN